MLPLRLADQRGSGICTRGLGTCKIAACISGHHVAVNKRRMLNDYIAHAYSGWKKVRPADTMREDVSGSQDRLSYIRTQTRMK